MCLYIPYNKKYNGKNKKKLQKYAFHKLGWGVVISSTLSKLNKHCKAGFHKQAS